MIFNEISEKIMRKILKKIKRKAIIFQVNIYDCNQQYDFNEFWTNLKNKEKMIYDDTFMRELGQKISIGEDDIENYKKQYAEEIINQIKKKQKCKKIMLGNYSNTMLSKFEKNIVLSYKYTVEDYQKSLKFYLKTNE